MLDQALPIMSDDDKCIWNDAQQGQNIKVAIESFYS